MTFGAQKSNRLGKTPNQSWPNLADMHRSKADNVQEILGAIGPVGGGRNVGSGEYCTAGFFFVYKTRWHFVNFSMADFHQFGHDEWIHVPSKGIGMHFLNFPYRSHLHFPPKKLRIEGCQTGRLPYSNQPTADYGQQCCRMAFSLHVAERIIDDYSC